MIIWGYKEFKYGHSTFHGQEKFIRLDFFFNFSIWSILVDLNRDIGRSWNSVPMAEMMYYRYCSLVILSLSKNGYGLLSQYETAEEGEMGKLDEFLDSDRVNMLWKSVVLHVVKICIQNIVDKSEEAVSWDFQPIIFFTTNPSWESEFLAS